MTKIHLPDSLGTYFSFNNNPKAILDLFIQIAKKKDFLSFDYEDDEYYFDDDYEDEDYDDDDYSFIDRPDILHRADCFDRYWEIYTEDSFCFGFTHLPVWIDKAVEQFNREFKNIKVNVLVGTEYGYQESINSWGHKYLEVAEDLEDAKYKMSARMFTIELSDKYLRNARMYIQYLVHHFFRMFSLLEEWGEYLEEIPQEDLIEYILDINNEVLGYRSISEVEITKEEFIKIDDIEAVNQVAGILDKTGGVKQTLILLAINGIINTEPIKVGDILELIPEHAYMDFGNLIGEKLAVLDKTPSGSMVLKRLSYPEQKLFYMNPISFRRVNRTN